MGQFGIGQPVTRFEDPRLLRGRGRYVDDVTYPDLAHACVLRSPHAHARIAGIDTEAAKAAPGVLAVLTGADHRARGFGTQKVRIPRTKRGGAPMFTAPQTELAHDTVRYVGDNVALVVAETAGQARDAAELISVDYDPLPVNVDTAAAADGAPALWPDNPDNISFLHEAGDSAAVDAAFAGAAHVVKQRFVINRITANSMEPRAALGNYDARSGRYVLHAGTQGVHAVRRILANDLFQIPEHRVQVITDDVGGGFGMKGGCYPEYLLVLWASEVTGRPVKWVGDRSEGIASDHQARDNVTDAELALDADGRFLGLRVHTWANIGAYYTVDRNAFPAISHLGVLSGTYTTPAIHCEVETVMTNSNCTAPFRGAGRPEAAFVIERMADIAADELGIDAAEIRRRNTIPADAMPYETGFLYTYDSGDFAGNLERALEAADYGGFAKRKAESAANGKLRGIGVSNTVELAMGQPMEMCEIRFDPSGCATFFVGTKAGGQGHETMYKQMLVERFGMDPDDFAVRDSDSDELPMGNGSFGSRSAFMGGTALYLAADKVIAKGTRIAAHLMEAAEADVEFADGQFAVAGTDKAISMKEVAQAAYTPRLPPGEEPGLFETGIHQGAKPTFPNGCHVCEVEIDPDTGGVALVKYTVVDDVGVVINPLTLKGQIMGGIGMGAGQALMEDLVYDAETGQLLTGSFQDYAIPRADDFPSFAISANEVPTPTNPLGAKGGGEAGTVGSLACVTNAVVDALSHLGVRHVDTPATPRKIWEIIRAASGSS